MAYELYYWPTLQGRGEFVRLALEEAGVPYHDVARLPEPKGGAPAMLALMGGDTVPHPPFAPPFLKAGRLLIGQTANILLFLGDHHGLAPNTEGGRLWVHQVQLTIADLVTEAHDTHHPIGASLYYEEQKAEAARRAADFRKTRMKKFYGWFETVLERSGGNFVGGRRATYADLSLFQVVEGLRWAFPKTARKVEKTTPRLVALHDAVAARPRIAAYLASERRLAFNETGIFRRYEELDG
ncbi:Glutathione S-transferase [Rhodovulum sp. PH10]|uniref:glutathione S-transferase n=1 Tax=Rhodovulum sp. PH10 TaxID=1187851 RepID=UPI00027C2AEF|nr:glutathione S-transferase [Rhodovulum sp. PH10]EJW12875.1 Glutathione S-transferase [Rhodovulum sp. PH10]